MQFENVLAELDGFGKFQLWMILLMVIPRVTLPFHFLMNNFIAAVPSHHCDVSTLDDGDIFRNLSQAERLAVGVPVQEDGTPSSCQMFAEPQYHLLLNSSNVTDLPTVPCQNGWVYDNTSFKSTLATEWDLVCDKRRVNKATATIFFMGVMLGAAVFGYLSDRFGRKRGLMISYVMTTVFGFASAFSKTFTIFAVTRFLTGFGIAGISLIPIVLCIEWVDIKHRTPVAVVMSMDWSVGTVLLPLVAYFVNDWRQLTATVTAPLFLAMITWRLLPESARWLISNGKVNSAHYYLSECAKVNHREQFMADLKPEVLSKVIFVENQDRKYSYLDLVKTPRLRRLTLLIGIVWFAVACTYYGISLNVTGFGVNIYLTQFIYGAIELPTKAFIIFSLDKIGRRLNQAGTLVLTGLCIFCSMFIPREMGAYLTAVGAMGKMFAEAAFTTVFLYTTELFPTVIRQNGLGYSSFMARLGVSVSPLIFLLEEVWLPLPSTVFCLVAFAAGLVATFLPETSNVRLSETIEDVEQTRRTFHAQREATMRFENILADINGFGRFQIMIIVISFVGRFTLPCHFMLNNFISAVPAHHCDVSSLDDGDIFRNLSQAERLAVGVPVQEDGTPSSCQMFAEPQYHLLLNSSNVTGLPTVPCQNGWVYDNTTFRSTLTSQWDLVCDRRGKNKATTTIFFVGVMFGAMTFGSLSDRFGRRIMLLVSYVTGMLFAVASAFSSSYVMFAVLRFLTGFCITGIVIVSSVLSLEWVDVEHRKLVGVVDSLSWTFGNTVFAAIAYFVNDWRWLIVSVTSPLILAIVTWRWMPESARWLIANGKLEQAQMYLKKCAAMNQTEKLTATVNTETLSTIVVTEKRDRTYTYIDLIRTPKLRKLALRTGILWFCVATTFYGISFNITGFKLNIYLTQFTYALIELPAKVSVYYLLDKIGRRSTEVGALLLAGVCLGINIVVPKDMSVIRTVVAVVGKGFSAASFTTVVLYSSELYPTVVRQNGMGFNSFMARLGVAVAPLILLLDDVWMQLPQVVLFSSAVLGGIVASTLPETRNRCLPETIEDVEQHW
ncbi:putative solute carrier family 22 member 7-like [Scophthalmus maximus]|uniref:Solute carrier family 22 member 6 n=1 Tax=Scophthalmus maximus TaxID=52904 RepID=A0A2U9BNV2_SCOMX|nr:putative solute carrier family 22 member 7-like [Scophthalmus maximus]